MIDRSTGRAGPRRTRRARRRRVRLASVVVGRCRRRFAGHAGPRRRRRRPLAGSSGLGSAVLVGLVEALVSMSSRPASSSVNCLSRSTNPSGRPGPASDGSRSGCAHSASRPSMPRDCADGLPQLRGGAQPARPQLQADQRREGLLGRPAGGAAAAQRLAQRGRAGQPVADRVGDHRVDPALDQREQRLELRHRALLPGRDGRLEHALAAATASMRRRVVRVDRRRQLLDRGEVDRDRAARSR